MQTLPEWVKRENGDLWFTENERENLKISYRIKDIVYEARSPYQHVMIIDSYDFGRALVLDGVVQTTSIDGFIYNEMIAHVPLSVHPCPERVLIIGGGDLGAAREAVKHEKVKHVDLVEIDGLVVEACRKYLPEVSGNLSDPRVDVIYEDGVQFAQSCTDQYDVVIIDSSDPVGPAKQLFELSFYRSVHRALKADGLMVCQSQSPVFHAAVMKQTFRNVTSLFPVAKLYTAVVPTYPGGLWSFTLGSKRYAAPAAGPAERVNARYFNVETLQRCFSLPQFIKEELGL